MNPSAIIELKRGPWSARFRLYGGALIVTLVYLLIGAVANDNHIWARINLPLSAISVMVVGLAGAEFWLFAQRLQRHHAALAATRARDEALAQHNEEERQSTLNELSRTLLDQSQFQRIPAELLEKIVRLFAAEAVGIWVVDKTGTFSSKGVGGLSDPANRELDAVGRSASNFEKVFADPQQLVTADFDKDTAPPLAQFCSGQKSWFAEGLFFLSPALAKFCAGQKLSQAVFTPVVCHGKIRGIVGAFYHTRQTLPVAVTGTMQTVANLVASAIQAEELYHDISQPPQPTTLGSLAGSIAHDLNNVLGAILASTSYLKQQTDPASAAYRYLDGAEASAHRGAALTKQLLASATGPDTAVASAPADATPATPTPVVRGGHERILLVEDESLIREMGQLTLAGQGYQVLTAADGISALELYRDQWANIDLVIADMEMPCLDGAALLDMMRVIHPAVRVIVTSGHSREREGQRMLQLGCAGYLQKPYTHDALNHLVRSVLDKR